jgi:hypothetical protein
MSKEKKTKQNKTIPKNYQNLQKIKNEEKEKKKDSIFVYSTCELNYTRGDKREIIPLPV